MAKALGMTPQGPTKNIPALKQRWKAPVKVWLHEMYNKRFRSKKSPQPGPAEGAPPKNGEKS